MISGSELSSDSEVGARLLENMTPRYVELDRLEKFVETKQYDHIRENWFSSNKPKWERKPTIAYSCVRTAITSNVDLCLGLGKFNGFNYGGHDGEFDEQKAVLIEAMRQCRFLKVAREALAMAQGARSVAVLYSIRAGKLRANTFKAKWCTPKFNDNEDVTELEVRYPYTTQDHSVNHPKALKAMLYRRVITATHDITYHPADAQRGGKEPVWVIKEEHAHGFDFCPVIWYPHMRLCQTHEEIDGFAIHEEQLDEIIAHDIILSQWNSTAFYSEPQPWETGVAQGESPGPSGVDSNPSTVHGGAITGANPQNGSYSGSTSTSRAVRQKGTGLMWGYANERVRLGYLTIPKDALDAMEGNARDLRVKIYESLAVVILDPDDIKFISTVSGKALATLKQRQTDRCDQIRDDFEELYLLPSLTMIGKILESVQAKGTALRLSAKTPKAGFSGMTSVEANWGSYYVPEHDEEETVLRMVSLAYDAGLITLEQAVVKIKPIFPHENTTALIKLLEAASLKRMEEEVALAKALEAAKPKPETQSKGAPHSTSAKVTKTKPKGAG